MQRLDYKNKKWEKRKERIIHNIQCRYNEIASLKEDYSNGKIDDVRYHSVLASYLKMAAEDEFVQGKHRKCYEYIAQSVEEFILAVKLLGEGKDIKQVTRKNVENKIKGGYWGYCALLVSDYDVMSQVTRPDATIIQMLSQKLMNQDAYDSVGEMELAISLRDSEKFEKALADRIKEIRKFDVENYICADFISMALVKEAKKAGMDFYSNYIEVDLKEEDMA